MTFVVCLTVKMKYGCASSASMVPIEQEKQAIFLALARDVRSVIQFASLMKNLKSAIVVARNFFAVIIWSHAKIVAAIMLALWASQQSDHMRSGLNMIANVVKLKWLGTV